MSDRQRISSGSPWEPVVGYSRAVRVGNTVYVSGTTATDETGAVVGEGDAYGQAVYAFRKIDRALREAGASLDDVVVTRMYVTDVSRWEEIGRAHAEMVGRARPAATMVEVRSLLTPGMLVEVEVIAEIPRDRG